MIVAVDTKNTFYPLEKKLNNKNLNVIILTSKYGAKIFSKMTLERTSLGRMKCLISYFPICSTVRHFSECHSAEYCSAKCCSAEYCSAECCSAKCHTADGHCTESCSEKYHSCN